MGQKVSLEGNEHLNRFSGSESLSVGDSFWRDMLQSFEVPLYAPNALGEKDLLYCRTCVFNRLYLNDLHTRNFLSLLAYVCRILNRQSSTNNRHATKGATCDDFDRHDQNDEQHDRNDDDEQNERTFVEIVNALFFVSIFAKQFIVSCGRTSPRRLLIHFGAVAALPGSVAAASSSSSSTTCQQSDEQNGDVAAKEPVVELLQSLICYLVYAADRFGDEKTLDDLCTMSLCQVAELLVLLLSAGSVGDREFPNVFKQHLLNDWDGRYCSKLLVETLLANVVDAPSPSSAAAGVGVGLVAAATGANKRSMSTPDRCRLATLSASLLLVLATCSSARTCVYRRALASLADSARVPSGSDDDDDESSGAHVPFAPLLLALTEWLGVDVDGNDVGVAEASAATAAHVEQSLALLYFLLNDSTSFRAFVLAKSDVETLLVPLLRVLYSVEFSERFVGQLYLLSGVFVLLTTLPSLNASLNAARLHRVAWYTEHFLADVSVCDLLLLVVSRALLRNLSANLCDAFVQQSLCAVLGNMARHVRSVHPTCAHQLVSLLANVARVAVRRYRPAPPSMQQQQQSKASPRQSSSSDGNSVRRAEQRWLYIDLIGSLLAFFNGCVTYSLQHNPHIAYALLRREDSVASLRAMSPAGAAERSLFERCIDNVLAAIGHFAAQLDDAALDEYSAGGVLAVIERSLRTWKAPAHLPSVIDPGRYLYSEEDDADDYWREYIWLVQLDIYASLLPAESALPKQSNAIATTNLASSNIKL
jgi:Dyggve-Melchior-Clausen syndrome protein